MFLKADRALSELNFLFHLNSKTNLVTLRKCVIHIICNIINLISFYQKQRVKDIGLLDFKNPDDASEMEQNSDACEENYLLMCLKLKLYKNSENTS